jgi:cation diffusion facilitator family transporter
VGPLKKRVERNLNSFFYICPSCTQLFHTGRYEKFQKRIQAFYQAKQIMSLASKTQQTHEQTAIKATYFSIFGNILLAIIKGLAGILGGSFALVADAIESTTDILASILVLFGLKYASRPADKNHPYGHGRVEPLITFLVVGFLVCSAVVIAHESIQNIKQPHALPKAWTLIVLGAIIIWKEISYQVVLRKSLETNSSSLKADAWHHRSDAITSVSAFVGISIALYFGQGYESADDWAALLASAFILYNSYLIFRPALGEIMDEHVYDELIDAIRAESLKVKGVLGTEKCFIRKAGMKYHVDLHAIVNAHISVKEGHDIAHALKEALREEIPSLGHVLIHIEPND